MKEKSKETTFWIVIIAFFLIFCVGGMFLIGELQSKDRKQDLYEQTHYETVLDVASFEYVESDKGNYYHCNLKPNSENIETLDIHKIEITYHMNKDPYSYLESEKTGTIKAKAKKNLKGTWILFICING